MKFERYGIGIVKGMTVTIRHLLRHPTVITVPGAEAEYLAPHPGQRAHLEPGEVHRLRTCAKACPQGAIEIVTATNHGGQ